MFKSFFRLWWSHLISVGFPQKSLGLTMTPWPEVAASVALVFPSRRTLWLGPSSWNDPRIVHLGALISAGQYHWAMCVYIYIHIYIYRIYDICIIYIYIVHVLVVELYSNQHSHFTLISLILRAVPKIHPQSVVGSTAAQVEPPNRLVV